MHHLCTIILPTINAYSSSQIVSAIQHALLMDRDGKKYTKGAISWYKIDEHDVMGSLSERRGGEKEMRSM